MKQRTILTVVAAIVVLSACGGGEGGDDAGVPATVDEDPVAMGGSYMAMSSSCETGVGSFEMEYISDNGSEYLYRADYGSVPYDVYVKKDKSEMTFCLTTDDDFNCVVECTGTQKSTQSDYWLISCAGTINRCSDDVEIVTPEDEEICYENVSCAMEIEKTQR